MSEKKVYVLQYEEGDKSPVLISGWNHKPIDHEINTALLSYSTNFNAFFLKAYPAGPVMYARLLELARECSEEGTVDVFDTETVPRIHDDPGPYITPYLFTLSLHALSPTF